MEEDKKTSTSTPNPAKTVKVPSLPTKHIRDDGSNLKTSKR